MTDGEPNLNAADASAETISSGHCNDTKIDANVATQAPTNGTAERLVIFDTGASSQRVLAARDIIDGLSNVELWSMIAWRDIKQRYRRSTFGPLWLTLRPA